MSLPFYTTQVAEAGGHPSVTIRWPEDCQAATDQGVALAERWLTSTREEWLWGSLIFERLNHKAGVQRLAFELGYLTRLHQRLVLPPGWNRLVK